MQVFFMIASLVASVAAGGFSLGFDKPQNRARESYVNWVNGQRQARVNDLAELVGASSGTYPRDGVPGTGIGGRVYGYPGADSGKGLYADYDASYMPLYSGNVVYDSSPYQQPGYSKGVQSTYYV